MTPVKIKEVCKGKGRDSFRRRQETNDPAEVFKGNVVSYLSVSDISAEGCGYNHHNDVR